MSITEASAAVVLEPASHTPAGRPTFGDMLDDVLPVVGVVFVAGPPVIFLAGPWLLLALILSGPFAVLFAFVAVVLAAAALLVSAATVVAGAYVLVRRVHRSYRGSHVLTVPATQVAAPVTVAQARP